MSQENVEVVRRLNEAWNERDVSAWLALFRSDAEIDWSRSRGPHQGTTFDHVHTEHHSRTTVGSDVVVPNTAHMWGRDGIEVTARSALVYTVENGLITRLRLFQERAEALEAVGVSE